MYLKRGKIILYKIIKIYIYDISKLGIVDPFSIAPAQTMGYFQCHALLKKLPYLLGMPHLFGVI